MTKYAFIFAFVVSMMMPVCAQKFQTQATSGQQIICIIDDDSPTVSVKRQGRPDGHLVIPSTVTYKGKIYTVTAIEERGFANCTNLTGVSLPNSVTEIEDEAFMDCTALVTINMPHTIKEIESRAFRGCTSIKTITLPNGIEEIGEEMFMGCTSLASVVIPASVKEIEERAFMGCTALSKITAHGTTAPHAERGAFSGVPSEVSVSVPNGSAASYRTAWVGLRNIK